MKNVPYVYLIGWSKLNIWYYGSRYSKHCNPDDLWKTYFTSSNYVKDVLKEHGNPDIIEIRKTFDNSNQALDWEKRVLSRMKVLYDSKWLNKNVGGRPYIEKQSKEHVQKRTQNKKHNPNQREIAYKACLVAAQKRIGKKDSEETKHKRVNTLKETIKQKHEGGWQPQKRRKFLIDGEIYLGLEEVMKKFNISMPTIYNRIKSQKFPNWSRYEE